MSGRALTGGLANVASIYGGQQPVGTTAPTNNGGYVTALPDGSVRYTNPMGVSTIIDKNGIQMADFSNSSLSSMLGNIFGGRSPGAQTGGHETGGYGSTHGVDPT